MKLDTVKLLTKAVVKGRWGYFFILPGYILFFVFSILPIIRAFGLSFFKADFTGQTWNGIKNYIYIFQDETFMAALRNTFMYCLIIVSVNLVISLFIAAVLARMHNKLQSILRSAFYLPAVIGGVVISAIWSWIYQPIYGLLNYILSIFGLGPIYWLGDSTTALLSVCIVIISIGIGTSIIIFIAGINGIPLELHEASKIDGATQIQDFFKITLPLLKPVIVFVVTTGIINAFQIWEVVYMLTEGGPNNTTTSLVYYLYKTAFVSVKYGEASAQGIILMLTIIIITVLNLRISREFEN